MAFEQYETDEILSSNAEQVCELRYCGGFITGIEVAFKKKKNLSFKTYIFAYLEHSPLQCHFALSPLHICRVASSFQSSSRIKLS